MGELKAMWINRLCKPIRDVLETNNHMELFNKDLKYFFIKNNENKQTQN